MSLTPNDFDPLAAIVDWLDACRSGNISDGIHVAYRHFSDMPAQPDDVRSSARQTSRQQAATSVS
jgi:hypothetical protein